MESLIKADIFFFISSISTVVLVVAILILLFYLSKAARGLCVIIKMLKEDVKDSEEFVEELEERLENNIIFRFLFPPLRRKRRDVSKDDGKKDK